MRRFARLAVGATAVGLVAAACSGDDRGGDAVPAAATTARAETSVADRTTRISTASRRTSTTVAPTSTSAPAADPDEVALTYVGAASPAAAAGTGSATPVVIGFVNEEGGTRSFPEATLGATAAVDRVNAVLGGVQGRALQLRPCHVVAPGDGERCAAELAADPDVHVVLVGAISRERLVGPLLDGLRGRKPVVLANPLTTREFVADDAYAFTPGAPGVIQGMSVFAARYLPGGRPALVAVAHADTAAGRAAYATLARPALDALGVASVALAVPDSATPEQLVAALAPAGGTAADAVIALTPVDGCIALADALAASAPGVPVVATELCRGGAMEEHLTARGVPGEAPEGWYFGGTGYSYAIRGNAEIDAYVATIGDYARQRGLSNLDPAGFAGPTYGSVLTIVRLMNGVRGGVTSPEVARAAIRSFTGPMWGVVGPMACGLNTVFPALCGVQVGIQQYVGGRWVSVRDGANGRPIDPRQELGGP